MSIAEELVKVLPGEWFAYTDGDYSVWPTGGCAPEWEAIALCGEEESPWFINWALDELAKRCYGVCLEWCGAWRVRLVKHRYTNEIVQGVYPAKTLALAHALIALGENDG